MNLYLVYVGRFEWCCFVFTTSRNRAKMLVMQCFGTDDPYTDYRCITKQKDVGGTERVIDWQEDEEYYRVTELGFSYKEPED